MRRRSIAIGTSAVLLAATMSATPLAAVADVGDGSIGGNVVGDEISFGDGVATAWRMDGGVATESYEAPIGADGDYEIAGLPAGIYKIGFNESGLSEDGLHGSIEWWNDSTTRAAGAEIVLGPGGAVSDIDADVDDVDGRPSDPTISGRAAVGQELRVDPGAWPAGTELFYLWFADDKVYELTEAPTVVLDADAVGAQMSVDVYGAIDAAGEPSDEEMQVKVSDVTDVVAAGPLAASTPAVAGALVVGETVTARTGSWTSGTSFRYQWYLDGVAVPRATSATWRLPAAAAGKAVTLKVVGDKAGYATTVRVSAPTARAALAATPTVSGVLAVGRTVSARPGSWTAGTGFTYQWYTNGKAIRGATKATYLITPGAASTSLTVRVVGSKRGHQTVIRVSAPSTRVAIAGTPAIAGRAQVGQRLEARTGRWTSGTRFAYQWYADGRAVSKATGATFTVPASARGKKITLKVVGSRAGHATVVTLSRPTAAVAAAPKAAPRPAAAPARSASARPVSKTSCPKSHPIKGNQTTRHTSDWIYHVPGGQFYNATHPEQCFSSESAAQKAGYRKSKR